MHHDRLERAPRSKKMAQAVEFGLLLFERVP
jgi:hypothetical protein